MENRIIQVIFIILTSFNLGTAQKNCNNHEKVPKEFYRSGYYESNMNAGFPYGAAFYTTKEEGLLNCSMTAFRLRSMTGRYFFEFTQFSLHYQYVIRLTLNSFSSLLLVPFME
jgi:hypothetical protein